MLRSAILCALWTLLAACQDEQPEQLGTWEHSEDRIEVVGFTWEHIDTLDKLTLRNATVSYDTLVGQSSRRVTFREDGTFHLNYVNAYDFSDFPPETLAKLKEQRLFDSTTYDGMGTWHTAGDSLWMEIEELIVYEDIAEIRLFGIPAAYFVYEVGGGEAISEEHRADLEELFPNLVNLFVEQMEFAGTYRLEDNSLLLTSLGTDGVERTRAYSQTTSSTSVGDTEGQPVNTSAN